MKRRCCVFLLLFLTAVIITPRVSAQDYIPIFSRDYGSRLSVEVDPLMFLLKGYSAHLRYQPMFSERFLIGVGTYSLDLPDAFVNLNRLNREQGWKVRIRSAYFLHGEFYAREANNGWFVGEQIGFQRFQVRNEMEAGGSARFNTVLLMTYVGYSWHPFKGSFYIKPWVGGGLTGKVDGLNIVGRTEYDISPFFGLFTLHLGYAF